MSQIPPTDPSMSPGNPPPPPPPSMLDYGLPPAGAFNWPDFITFRNAAEARQPLYTVRIDDKGLWK